MCANTWRLLAAVLALCLADSRAKASEPRTNYQLFCMGCHVEDGSGLPGRVPAIRETLTPFALRAAGRRFIVQVPGTAQSPLSNADTAALLNWMIRNIGGGQLAATPRDFTEDEVAGYRSQRLIAVRATRAALLAEIRASTP